MTQNERSDFLEYTPLTRKISDVKELPIITYDMLETLPTKKFEKYLLVTPGDENEEENNRSDSEVWTEVPNFIAALIITLRDKHDKLVKTGATFPAKSELVSAQQTRALASNVWSKQNDWTGLLNILTKKTAAENFECLRYLLSRLEKPILHLSDDTIEFIRSGEYSTMLAHRSMLLGNLVEDAQAFVTGAGVTADHIDSSLSRLYEEKGPSREEEKKATNGLRTRLRRDLLGLQRMRSNTLRFVMRNIFHQFNNFVYKSVWRVRLERGLSHKEAKGVIQPMIEQPTVHRLAKELGPRIIGFDDPAIDDQFKVKVFGDIINFVSARCWFTFEKKEKMLDIAPTCHRGCTCGLAAHDGDEDEQQNSHHSHHHGHS